LLRSSRYRQSKEKNRLQGIEVTFVGAPKKDGHIAKSIRELGIGHRIHFTGQIDNGEFVRLYARASVAVVPSVYDRFGLPAGEAMACAVPVISTTGGALPEVVGDAGILVPPANQVSLIRAIAQLIDYPEQARELRWTGYRRI